MTNRKLKIVIALAAVLVLGSASPFLSGAAHAAPPPQFQQAFVRLDRMAATTPTGGTVCATPATTAVEADVQVIFPTVSGTDFTVNTTASNWTVTTSNLPSGATAWPGIGTATSVSGKTVTFPSGVLTVAIQYCFNFAGVNTLTTSASGNSLAGTVHTRDASQVIIDETNYAFSIITNDQIVVSAVVPPTFIFVLSGNTDAFPANLDPATVLSTAGRTISITTNAKGGWITWVKDSQQGLYSAGANYRINTSGVVGSGPVTLTNNSEGYVLNGAVTTDALNGCTVNIASDYNGAGANDGGPLSSNFQPVASCTGAAPATSNGDVITLVEKASIAGGTPAGSDYSDIITLVGAGNF